MQEFIFLEQESYGSIQAYHAQLWIELIELFRIQQGFCDRHQIEAEASISRAILFTLSGATETACRVLAAATLLANAHLESKVPIHPENEPQPINPLTDTEKLFLSQESAEIDKRTWSVKRTAKFVSFEDALLGYPKIYARLFGVEMSIDTSRSEWDSIKKAKQLRDLGAHGNIAKSGKLKSHIVTYSDLEDLLLARLWYCKQLESLPWVAGVENMGEIKVIDLLLQRLKRSHKKK